MKFLSSPQFVSRLFLLLQSAFFVYGIFFLHWPVNLVIFGYVFEIFVNGFVNSLALLLASGEDKWKYLSRYLFTSLLGGFVIAVFFMILDISISQDQSVTIQIFNLFKDGLFSVSAFSVAFFQVVLGVLARYVLAFLVYLPQLKSIPAQEVYVFGYRPLIHAHLIIFVSILSTVYFQFHISLALILVFIKFLAEWFSIGQKVPETQKI